MPRERTSVLHVDADSFFASVEQVQKPSLAGRPVLVGGIGPRGVVATASYEARQRGARSAMPMSQARRLCPDAAVLTPRFPAYASHSAVLLGLLRELSPLVEPVSLDEAFVDLDGGPQPCPDPVATAAAVRAAMRARTGLAVSAGLGRSKLIAKLASDAAKPDGLRAVPAAEEESFLLPLPVTALWGVGPATAGALLRLGVRTVAELRELSEATLVTLLGPAAGSGLHRVARGRDDRPVRADRVVKSVGAERTFPTDLSGRESLHGVLERIGDAALVRLRRHGGAARTVVVKARFADFETVTRSVSLPQPAVERSVLLDAARRGLDLVGFTAPVRLLGVSFHGLTGHAQLILPLDGEGLDDIDHATDDGLDSDDAGGLPVALDPGNAAPGLDVEHPVYGRGWLAGLRGGEVTVRFESALTGPGPARVFDIRRAPLVLVEPAPPVAAGRPGATDPGPSV